MRVMGCLALAWGACLAALGLGFGSGAGAGAVKGGADTLVIVDGHRRHAAATHSMLWTLIRGVCTWMGVVCVVCVVCGVCGVDMAFCSALASCHSGRAQDAKRAPAPNSTAAGSANQKHRALLLRHMHDHILCAPPLHTPAHPI